MSTETIPLPTEAEESNGARGARERFLDSLAESGASLSGGGEGPARILSFGDPEAEYRALGESVALRDDSDRTPVRVRPGRKPERTQEVLAGLLTNHYARTEPGEALYSFLLTPAGRPVAELRAINLGDEHWLDLPAACLDGTLEYLEKYLPPLFAVFELSSVARVGLVGPAADRALTEGSAGPDPSAVEPLGAIRRRVAGAPAVAVRREPIEGPGWDLYLPAGALAEAWTALETATREAGGRAAGWEAYDAWRVERGVPAYGADISRDNLPQETGQEGRAISFEKGCYTGQEVVVRIHHRGHVNRHLRGLRFRDRLPEPGAELYREERARGVVTSPVRSPRLGPVALGYVRREVEPGGRLALEPGGEATVEVAELPLLPPER